MFKTVMMLMRGASARAEEGLADRHALLLLDQQVRDVAATLEGAKRSLSIAIAQGDAERARLATLERSVTDLEDRAVAALAAGRDDLAGEAAAALVGLEADRATLRETTATLERETAALRARVERTAAGLTALERGRRIARAADAVERLGAAPGAVPALPRATLAEAEATLRRLRARQTEDAEADRALETIEAELAGAGATRVAAKLGEAGFGASATQTAASILDRLRAKARPVATA